MREQSCVRILMVGAFGNSYYIPNELQCAAIADNYYRQWSRDCEIVRTLMLSGF